MDFGEFRKAVDHAAGVIAPSYKKATMLAAPIALTYVGMPYLTPFVEVALQATPDKDVLALGLAESTAGLSLFLFVPPPK